MSLESLRNLRRAGRKPDAVVKIIVGPKPNWLDDTAAVVHIRPDATPEDMDWRPTIGMWVVVFLTGNDRALGARVLACLEAAKAKVYGAADLEGTYPCIADATERHHKNLRQSMELLCQ